MYSQLIEQANVDQLRKFTKHALEESKLYNEKLYDELRMELYKEINGYHFNEWLLDKALKKLVNEDGTTGGHWTLEQTTMVARNNGIDFKDYNEYDWNYVMNMIYSDYYGAVPNETNVYVKMAKKFLEDKDSEKGKAIKYYFAICD